MRNLEETFRYDDQNRLTDVQLGAVCTGASAYDSYGRMKSKTADGGAVFTAANNSFNMADRPHALKSAAVPPGLFPSTTQTVSYTGFDKTLKVKQGNDSLVYTYGHDQQRIAMEEHVGGAHRIKRYVGGCEYVTETEVGNTLTRSLTYLTGPFGVFAVVEKCNGEEILHYILKDNLGSWTTITDSDGNVEQRLSYDAWGSLRDPGTWSGSFTGKPMLDRGFTGHEHLTAFGLINMKFTLSERSAKLCLSTAERCDLGGANGRMYDPVMSSFLSVDRFLQNPSTSQGFNRYAYCMYNPLRYVDPTGFYMTSGNRHHPDDPPHEIIDGQVVFWLPEVTITPYDEPPVTVNESPYPNTTSGGGSHFDWSDLINNNANGSTIGQGGGSGSVGSARNNSSNSATDLASATLTTMWVSSFVEPTCIGEVFSLAVTGAFTIYYGKELITKMKDEIAHLQTRLDGPDGFVYELRENTDGMYPCVRTASWIYLEAGDVWKIGETTQEKNRYSDNWMRAIGDGGVTMQRVYYGNQRQIKIQEKIMIYNYYFRHGHLPPGNKIFR